MVFDRDESALEVLTAVRTIDRHLVAIDYDINYELRDSIERYRLNAIRQACQTLHYEYNVIGVIEYESLMDKLDVVLENRDCIATECGSNLSEAVNDFKDNWYRISNEVLPHYFANPRVTEAQNNVSDFREVFRRRRESG